MLIWRSYGVKTKVLNQAVKRNQRRFPKDFAFHLNAGERREVVTNCDHLSKLKFGYQKPLVFTEFGALMAANVLNSERAVRMSVFVIRAFVKMRERFTATVDMEKKLWDIEKNLISHDVALRDLYLKIKPMLLLPTGPIKPKRQIGFTVKETSAGYKAGDSLFRGSSS